MPADGAGATAPEVRCELQYADAKAHWLDHFERVYLADRLRRAGGNVSRLAREADVDRAHLIKLLQKHGLR